MLLWLTLRMFALKTLIWVRNVGLTEVLLTLEQSGFIRPYLPFGSKKKGTVYQLVDGFSLFHHRFLIGESKGDSAFWTSTADSPQRAAWLGLSGRGADRSPD